MNIETWTIAGERLAAESRALTWAIGDWLLEGDEVGATYEQAEEVTGLARQTLMNAKYLADAFPFSRRRERLSAAHHMAVAALPAPDGDRLLLQAERESWSVKRLRQERNDLVSLAAGEIPESVRGQLLPTISQTGMENLRAALAPLAERIDSADLQGLAQIIDIAQEAERALIESQFNARRNLGILLKLNEKTCA